MNDNIPDKSTENERKEGKVIRHGDICDGGDTCTHRIIPDIVVMGIVGSGPDGVTDRAARFIGY